MAKKSLVERTRESFVNMLSLEGFKKGFLACGDSFFERLRFFHSMKNPTEAMCVFAVQQDGHLLDFIEVQTPEICIAAVRQDYWALRYVKEQTSELCLEAIQQDSLALSCVREQTPEICLAAVRKDGYALRLVKVQTEEICMEAVKQNGWALQHVKEQTPGICLAAVRQSPKALQFVEVQTREICLEALAKDKSVAGFVKNKEWLPEEHRRFCLGDFDIRSLMGEVADAAWYGKGETCIKLISGVDVIQLDGYVYEPGYEWFSAASSLSLNGEVLYGIDSRNVAAYRNETFQVGKFERLEDAIGYLREKLNGRDVLRMDLEDGVERNVESIIQDASARAQNIPDAGKDKEYEIG